MKIAFIADGRSEHTRRWINYFSRDFDVLFISTYACEPIQGVSQVTLSGRFRLSGQLVNESCENTKNNRVASEIIKRLLRNKFINHLWQLLKIVDLPRQVRECRRVLVVFRPDIVHALRIQNEGYIAAFSCPDAYVLSSWGSDFIDTAANSLIHRTLTRYAVRHAACFFSDCHRDISLARQFGLADNIAAFVFPGNGGVSADNFYPATTLCNSMTILYSRGLSRATNVDVLFDAVAQLRMRFGEVVCLTVLAPSSTHAVFSNLAHKFGIPAEAIDIRSYVEPPELGVIMREHSVFVSPLVSDGTPNSMLEAMACGIIPVMSDLESIREHITDGINGYLFDPNSSQSLILALEKALTTPSKGICEHNIKYISTTADYSTCMKQVVEVYDQMSNHHNALEFDVIETISEFDIELERFGFGGIFVSEAWLDFTCKETGGKFVGVRIRNCVGLTSFFAGVLFRKFGVKIIGSPFPGWGTSYMGVCGQLSIDDSLVGAMLEFLFERYGPHYVEIVSPPCANSLVSGNTYSVSHLDSLLLSLTMGLDSLYANFKGDCRTYLRQFKAKGGVVTAVDGDSAFVELFYEQLIEVFARQGMVPTHSRQRISLMLEILTAYQADILCLQACGPNNELLASSVFFGANGTFHYWAGASYATGRHFRPTEAMIWEAIQHFSHLGYHSFDMMGVRDYKLKFSPQPISYTRITASRFAIFLSLRNWAQRSYFLLNRMRGMMRGNRNINLGRLSKNISIKSFEQHEFAHYQSDDLCIFSDSNILHIRGATELRIELPQSFLLRLLAHSRLFRRLMRLDKSCVMLTANGLIIIWQGVVYHWSESNGLCKTLTMQGCRNPMHHSIAKIDELTFVFGEYGNPHSSGKNIYKTVDGGCTWTVVFNFPSGTIRHIHNCIWDIYAQRLWIFTGDFDGECKVASATADFSDIRYYGDGTQTYRTTGAFMDAKYVYWIMDSPLVDVRLVRLDKTSGEVTFGQTFAGPIYYYTRTRDGVYLVSSAQEPGPSLTDRKVHIYASRNLKKWIDIGSFERDGLPKRLFRFGVGVFPLGDYGSDDVMMSFDSVKSFDGKVIRLAIKGV